MLPLELALSPGKPAKPEVGSAKVSAVRCDTCKRSMAVNPNRPVCWSCLRKWIDKETPIAWEHYHKFTKFSGPETSMLTRAGQSESRLSEEEEESGSRDYYFSDYSTQQVIRSMEECKATGSYADNCEVTLEAMERDMFVRYCQAKLHLLYSNKQGAIRTNIAETMEQEIGEKTPAELGEDLGMLLAAADNPVLIRETTKVLLEDWAESQSAREKALDKLRDSMAEIVADYDDSLLDSGDVVEQLRHLLSEFSWTSFMKWPKDQVDIVMRAYKQFLDNCGRSMDQIWKSYRTRPSLYKMYDLDRKVTYDLLHDDDHPAYSEHGRVRLVDYCKEFKLHPPGCTEEHRVKMLKYVGKTLGLLD